MMDKDDDVPCAISSTLRTYNMLRDGTLRVVIDIDPRFKAGFHKLFPDIDTPVAIAPLPLDFERRAREEKQTGGALCKLAGMWCRDEDFQRWLASLYEGEVFTEEDAANWIRTQCGVESRVELDSDDYAAKLFQEQVRLPYMNWLRGYV